MPPLTQDQRRDCIARIAHFPEALEGLVLSLSMEQLHTRYMANEWTVAQNVHHVADSHMNAFVRLKRILTEDRPLLAGYNQDAWALSEDYSPSIAESLRIVRGLHARWVALFESLTDEQWARIGIHSEIGEITPDDLVQTYANHGEGHIGQIQRTLAAGQ